MATHSSILAWRIPQTEEPGGPQSTWLQSMRITEATENACTLDKIEKNHIFIIKLQIELHFSQFFLLHIKILKKQSR